jgi:AcrR family transcriptional regulator
MKRASTEEKKLERRGAILGRARAYIATRSFEEIRLSDLARELGLVKGTLYLYFPTKQDLFASILMEDMDAWWDALLKRRATRFPGKDIVRSLPEHQLMIRLLASLHMTIEPGLSPEGLRRVKTWFRDFALRASGDLEERYAGLAGRGFGLLMGIYALVVGISQIAFPPHNVRALLESDATLEIFRVDFGGFLAESIDALYKGTRRR